VFSTARKNHPFARPISKGCPDTVTPEHLEPRRSERKPPRKSGLNWYIGTPEDTDYVFSTR